MNLTTIAFSIFVIGNAFSMELPHASKLLKLMNRHTTKMMLPLALFMQTMNSVGAIDVDTNCLKNVIRVQTSLQYVEKDIEQIAEMPKIIANIKALQRNYKLDENIMKTLNLVPTLNSARSDAREHGRAAIEDLAQIYEYFSDQIDDLTGNPKTTPETLRFALEATKAAEKELSLLVDAVPSEIASEAINEVKSEFTSS